MVRAFTADVPYVPNAKYWHIWHTKHKKPPLSDVSNAIIYTTYEQYRSIFGTVRIEMLKKYIVFYSFSLSSFMTFSLLSSLSFFFFFLFISPPLLLLYHSLFLFSSSFSRSFTSIFFSFFLFSITFCAPLCLFRLQILLNSPDLASSLLYIAIPCSFPRYQFFI